MSCTTQKCIALCTFVFAASLKSLFIGRVSYSPSGSNAKRKEVSTYVLFADFLEDCGREGNLIGTDIQTHSRLLFTLIDPTLNICRMVLEKRELFMAYQCI